MTTCAEIAKKAERLASRLICYFKGHQQPWIEVPRVWRKEARLRPKLDHIKVWRCPRCGKMVLGDANKVLITADSEETKNGTRSD